MNERKKSNMSLNVVNNMGDQIPCALPSSCHVIKIQGKKRKKETGKNNNINELLHKEFKALKNDTKTQSTHTHKW